jgi:hypothetical protein
LKEEARLVFVNIRLARITVGLSTLAIPISDFGTQDLTTALTTAHLRVARLVRGQSNPCINSVCCIRLCYSFEKEKGEFHASIKKAVGFLGILPTDRINDLQNRGKHNVFEVKYEEPL